MSCRLYKLFKGLPPTNQLFATGGSYFELVAHAPYCFQPPLIADALQLISQALDVQDVYKRQPEDSDATAALLTGPLGLYMLLSKTYILYEDKEPKEATEASRSGAVSYTHLLTAWQSMERGCTGTT